jgi:hypothetical protein
MTIPTWPTTLPRPERQSFQKTWMDGRLKRQTDSGPPGYRRRFSSVAKPVSLSILTSREQQEVFETFYEDETAGGSLPFYMPDPTKDGWPLLDESGRPLLGGDGRPVLMSARWLCFFGDTLPVITVVGIEFRISFNIVVMP